MFQYHSDHDVRAGIICSEYGMGGWKDSLGRYDCKGSGKSAGISEFNTKSLWKNSRL